MKFIHLMKAQLYEQGLNPVAKRNETLWTHTLCEKSRGSIGNHPCVLSNQ